MSVNRDSCAAVVIKNNNSNNDNPRQRQQQSNKILVFGGWGPAADAVDSCDIINNTLNHHQQHQQWRQLGRRMPMALRGLAALNLEDNDDTSDKVYLFGGYNLGEGGTQNRCYEYDVTSDTYKNMPSMKTKRRYFASVGVKNKLLFAIGGWDENDNELDTIEYFDITSDNNNAEWCILKAKMNKKRCFCCSASVGDIFYVIGGLDGNGYRLDSIEMYDTSKQNSKFLLLDAKMKNKRHCASAVVLGCYIVIIGGEGNKVNDLNSIEIFNTKTQEFLDSSNYVFPKMTMPRSYFTAVLVDNNYDDNNDTIGMDTNSKKILVVGGRTAEVIDIKTTAIPISKFSFTKLNGDEYGDGKLPSEINTNIISFLI